MGGPHGLCAHSPSLRASSPGLLYWAGSDQEWEAAEARAGRGLEALRGPGPSRPMLVAGDRGDVARAAVESMLHAFQVARGTQQQQQQQQQRKQQLETQACTEHASGALPERLKLARQWAPAERDVGPAGVADQATPASAFWDGRRALPATPVVPHERWPGQVSQQGEDQQQHGWAVGNASLGSALLGVQAGPSNTLEHAGLVARRRPSVDVLLHARRSMMPPARTALASRELGHAALWHPAAGPSPEALRNPFDSRQPPRPREAALWSSALWGQDLPAGTRAAAADALGQAAGTLPAGDHWFSDALAASPLEPGGSRFGSEVLLLQDARGNPGAAGTGARGPLQEGPILESTRQAEPGRIWREAGEGAIRAPQTSALQHPDLSCVEEGWASLDAPPGAQGQPAWGQAEYEAGLRAPAGLTTVAPSTDSLCAGTHGWEDMPSSTPPLRTDSLPSPASFTGLAGSCCEASNQLMPEAERAPSPSSRRAVAAAGAGVSDVADKRGNTAGGTWAHLATEGNLDQRISFGMAKLRQEVQGSADDGAMLLEAVSFIRILKEKLQYPGDKPVGRPHQPAC